MKEKTVKIDIGLIDFDTEFYPRYGGPDWQTVAKYADAMRLGDEFPPPVVGKRKGRYVIIDGVHRYQAYEKLDASAIECVICEAPESKWLFLAAQYNVRHGRPLTKQDRIAIANKLKVSGVSWPAIEKLLNVPKDKLTMWCLANTADDGSISKAAVQSAVGTTNETKAIRHQAAIANANINRTLDEFIALIRGGALDREKGNPTVADKCCIILEALEKRYGAKV